MDFLMTKRAAQFPDAEELESLRTLGEQIRQYNLGKLPDLLEQLEANLTRNGIQVHWAETPDEANAIILGICKRHSAKLMVKGKSMVSEEIELNHAAEAAGIGALESDMGEYIVQLAGEKPSHIIMPAIHKTKEEIATLFHEKVPGVDYTDNVDALIQIGRKVLREKFLEADIGLSGVNFAVAETGTLCLVENEGNGRMCTTTPPVHIAITGIEKIVEKLEHVPPLLSLLTRSATGQNISTYFNMISGPRKPGEKDGPSEVHLVLLDNGRSAGLRRRAVAQDPAMHPLRRLHEPLPGLYPHRRPRLRHHLPRPDRQDHLAAHAWAGGDPATMATASSLCGACGEVCPVKIPIPDLLMRLREEAFAAPHANPALRGQGAGYNGLVCAVWRGWAMVYRSPLLYGWRPGWGAGSAG
jgi:L-lactate dehydrogenase complex protein LldF